MEHITPSGLSVVERVKPRTSEFDLEPSVPNGNPPSTVGDDNLDPGRFVMYPWQMPPPEAQGWSGWPVGWNVPFWGGTSHVDALIARVSTAWTCMDLNASVLSTMPPYIVKATTPQPALPYLANPEPEVYTSWADFAKSLFLFYQLGEVFVWATARYANGFPQRFVCLRSDWVQVEWIDGVRRYSLGGMDITADVLHIRYTTIPGNARGIGPLETCANALIGAAALEKYSRELATTGGVPWAVLNFPDELDDKQVDDIHARWITARMRAMGAPAVISGGFELKPLTFNPKDMALLDLRNFDETRIAVALGVPPYLVGLSEGQGTRLTYTNVSQLFDYHWRAGLRPKAEAVMSALSNWLLPTGTNIELNRDEYTRPDLQIRAQTYAILFAIVDPITGERAITVDEIRNMERFAPYGSTGPGTAALTGDTAPPAAILPAPSSQPVTVPAAGGGGGQG